MKRAHGFGLVEMMIAIAIMAVLMAVAIPSFRTFIQNAQVRSAAESMLAGLNHARTEALRRNGRVSLWTVSNLSGGCARSSAGTSWVVSFDNPAGHCNAAASDTVAPRLIQSRAGSDGSSNVAVSALTATAAGTSCITFNGIGGLEPACSDGGTPMARVVFSTSTATALRLELRITAGGAIRMCNPAETNTANPAYC